jgi:hypothetical protein
MVRVRIRGWVRVGLGWVGLGLGWGSGLGWVGLGWVGVTPEDISPYYLLLTTDY